MILYILSRKNTRILHVLIYTQCILFLQHVQAVAGNSGFKAREKGLTQGKILLGLQYYF